MSRPKKHILNIVESTPFRAIGISSAAKEHKICFVINRNLGFDFKKNKELNFFNKSENTRFLVPCFHHYDALSLSNFYLVKNRQEFFFINDKYKKADYFFIFTSAELDKVYENCFQQLNTVPIIQSTFEVASEILKNIEID